jgi:hypothetical protein
MCAVNLGGMHTGKIMVIDGTGIYLKLLMLYTDIGLIANLLRIDYTPTLHRHQLPIDTFKSKLLHDT